MFDGQAGTSFDHASGVGSAIWGDWVTSFEDTFTALFYSDSVVSSGASSSLRDQVMSEVNVFNILFLGIGPDRAN